MSATRKAPSLTEACSEITDLEQRSLLPHAPESDQNRAHNQEVAPRVRARTPLPVVALLILLVVRIVEPIGFSQIFPYMNQMIEHLGIAAPEDIGYYSGLVDTCLSFAQLATVYFWSSLSDRIGRKPVVIIGVSGAALSAVCFGFSTSLPAMLASRSIAGALGGNAAVVSSMVGEMTDETNQGIAFILLGATWWIGCILGPALGGALSNPATKWPEIFKPYPLFQTYPYLLPCLVSSLLSIISAFACGIFVKETLPLKIAREMNGIQRETAPTSSILRASSSVHHYGSITSNTPHSSTRAKVISVTNQDRTTSKAPSSLATHTDDNHDLQPTGQQGTSTLITLISQPHIRAILAVNFVFNVVRDGFDEVFALYSYTRVDLGGMGLTPSQIGWILSISGTVGTSSLLALPYLQYRFNNRHLYTFFACFTPVTFALMPIGHLVASQTNGTADSRLWVALGIILIPTKISVNLYPLTMIIVKSSVDNPSHLGSMFGFQQTTASIARGIAPYFASSLFALSVGRNLLGGNLVWVIMVLLGLCGVWMSTRVRNVQAPQRLFATGRNDGSMDN